MAVTLLKPQRFSLKTNGQGAISLPRHDEAAAAKNLRRGLAVEHFKVGAFAESSKSTWGYQIQGSYTRVHKLSYNVGIYF